MRLLTLPVTVVRVPFEIGFGAAKQAVKFAHGLVGGGEAPVVDKPRPAPARRRPPARKSGNGRAAGSRPRKRATAAATPPQATEAPTPPEPVAEPEAIAEPPVAVEEPAHVSEEPELVAETAETGAEDGAGAEVDVEEPWTGYDEMTAADIEDRLLAEGPEAAAAVSLYEASHKGRASILEAASRSMAT